MPRILLITDSLSNGGAERQFCLLAHLFPTEWPCLVFSLDDGPYLQLLKKDKIPTIVSKRQWKYDITPFGRLWSTLVNWKPSIVYSWSWMTTLACFPLCRFFKIPLVDGTVRTGFFFKRRGSFISIGHSLADHIIGNSKAGLDAYHIPNHKRSLIYNGFESERLTVCESRAKKLTDLFTVVMTGRMVNGKDYDTFFMAAQRMLALKRNIKFVAVGTGPNLAYLQNKYCDILRSGHGVLTNVGMEVLEVVRESDVGVHINDPTYWAEGCSNSIMEYMACALPVVCSDTGGNRELVLDEETGFVISPLTVEGFVEKLCWLQDHSERAANMGRSGRERILQEFTADKMVKSTIDVFEQLISRQSK